MLEQSLAVVERNTRSYRTLALGDAVSGIVPKDWIDRLAGTKGIVAVSASDVSTSEDGDSRTVE